MNVIDTFYIKADIEQVDLFTNTEVKVEFSMPSFSNDKKMLEEFGQNTAHFAFHGDPTIGFSETGYRSQFF